jgi:predicted metal-dependent phosphoesterase TrpH
VGLRALWITDHDMIRDLDRTRQIQAAARKAGVDVSFGVEITVRLPAAVEGVQLVSRDRKRLTC